MKFIINQKLYDTEKATLIAEGEKQFEEDSAFFGKIYPKRDVKLYKTQKGAFFYVYNKDYGTICAMAISEDEAKSWLMHKAYNKYVELYGELEEA